MRAGIQASRPDFSLRRATLVVTSLAKVLALVSIVLALLLWSDETNEVIPIWFTFMLLALLMYFTARYEEERTVEPPGDDQLFGYDFSEGFTSLERTSSSSTQTETIGPFRRWLEERRQARLQQQRDLEREEEQRVDEILGRLHLHGMQCLSHDERSLLERVSQRYRHRQERSS
jgi:stage IV sporulation protein FB